MIKLFEGGTRHIPDEPIMDGIYLWFVDWFEAWLCIEEWEFRIYNYEYRSYDSIVGWWHEDEEWRNYTLNFFLGAEDCLDIETIQYTVPKFSSMNPVDIAEEIYLACNSELDDISPNIVWENDNPSQELVDFIRRWITKIKNTKTYAYYK